jgi:hypothetical protein
LATLEDKARFAEPAERLEHRGSSAWIWLLSSIDSITAWAGGSI